uniref:DNA polymerase alpha subunit B n=1 Tax=Myxobolus squamalis TaxID=59785 RepID=A0A6B2G2Z2_MYXSQ
MHHKLDLVFPEMSKINFMFQKLTSIISHLDMEMSNLVKKIHSYHSFIKSFNKLGQVCLDETFVFGRICAKTTGSKIGLNSIYIEGNLKMCDGIRIKLDISSIKSLSLFPGQVVIAKGIHPQASIFVASQILVENRFPLERQACWGSTLRGVVVAGPFYSEMSPSTDYISTIAQILKSELPDLLIFIGPFVEYNCYPKDEKGDISCGKFLDNCIEQLVSVCSETGTRIVMVPSVEDVCSIPIFPQTPTFCSKHNGINQLPNPYSFQANSFDITVTSMDILLHMSGFEFSYGEQESDRISRMLKHILNHKRF